MANFRAGVLKFFDVSAFDAARTTSGKVRRFAVRRKYSEGGIEVITDEDDDDKDTEDESNNNLDEIDKLVLDVVKENVQTFARLEHLSSGDVRSVCTNTNRNHETIGVGETVRNNFRHLPVALVYKRSRYNCARETSNG